MFSLNYIFALVLLTAWFSTNFENTEIDDQIKEIDQALQIDSLKYWDEYLYEVASCFHRYYQTSFDGRIIDSTDLKNYIEKFKKRNEEITPWTDIGKAGHFPIDTLKAFLDSDEFWFKCRFWKHHNTLVGFLLSTHYYLHNYTFKRLQAKYEGTWDSILLNTDSITRSLDTVIVRLFLTIDSMAKPFEYAVRVGWNPFLQSHGFLFSMGGRTQDFENYDKRNIASRIDILNKLNIITNFTRLIRGNSSLLDRVKNDLDEIVFSNQKSKKVSFTKYPTDVNFSILQEILESPLINRVPLSDSIQLKRVYSLSADYEERLPIIYEHLLDYFYPEYVSVLKKYNLDRISGVKSLRSLLVTQKQFGPQRLQVFGASMSYVTIIVILPSLIFSLYFLATIFVYHLSNLVKHSRHDLSVPISKRVLLEIFRAPTFLSIKPTLFGRILTFIPALITLFVVVDQLGIVGYKSVFLGAQFVILFAILFSSILIMLLYIQAKLTKVLK